MSLKKSKSLERLSIACNIVALTFRYSIEVKTLPSDFKEEVQKLIDQRGI